MVSACLRDKRLYSREKSLSPFTRLTATIDWYTGSFSDRLLGDFVAARMHLEQGITRIDPVAQRDPVLRHGEVPGVRCLAYMANTLWCLGYPAQAVQRAQEALSLAQRLAHPYSLVLAQHWAATLHYHRRDLTAVQTLADALLSRAATQGFPQHGAYGTYWRGWVLAMQGEGVAGLAQFRQGLVTIRATGAEQWWSLFLVVLAEAAGHADQVEEKRD